jgi:hypothetical protein
MAVIIPDWVPPKPKPPADVTGQRPPDTANNAARNSTPGNLQLTALGRDQMVPILYGGPERMAGLVYCVATPRELAMQGKLVFAAILCEGPVESISGFEVNGEAMPGYINIVAYDGSQTTVDPWLAAAIPGFNETLNGTAYFVAQVAPVDQAGFPQITALVKGLRVYDPRENHITYSETFTASQWQYPSSTPTHGVSDPRGGASAVTITNTAVGGRITGSFVVPDGITQFDYGVSVRPGNVGTVALLVYNSTRAGTVFSQTITIASGTPESNGFYRLSSRMLSTDGVGFAPGETLIAYVYPNNTSGAIGNSVTVWGFHIRSPGKQYAKTGASAIMSVTRWSDNPALCTHDFMANMAGLAVDDAYTASAADRCDEIVTGAAGSEKRCTMTLLLNEKRTCEDWIDTLRQYIPAWVVDAGNAWRIVADMPRNSDHSFGPDTIDTDSLPELKRGGSRDVPNAVDVFYTDTQTVPWELVPATVEGAGAATDVRRSRVDLPGIRRYSQAYRFAVERLNHYTLEDTTGSISIFDYGLKVLPGDIATISEAAFGWAAKEVRVLDVRDKGNGRWEIDFREYDPLAYSGLVQAAPTMPETALSSPLECLPVTNLVVGERLTPESALVNDGIGTSIIYQSRVYATWDDSADPYVAHYQVRVYRGQDEISAAVVPRGVQHWLSQPVQQLTSYRVDVYAVNSLSVFSPSMSQNVAIDGKKFPPGDVPAIIQAMEIGGEVLFMILPASDFDTIRYQWRVDLGNTGLAWNAMNVVDTIDSLRARFRGIPEGTHRFCVKAIDSVGNFSANERCSILTVTLDENAFVRDLLFVNPTLVSMVASMVPFIEGESSTLSPTWFTNDPAKSWDTAMPSPIDSGTEPVYSYGKPAGIASWRGEMHDLGYDLTAAFRVSYDGGVASGGVRVFIEHSFDGTNWTQEELVGDIGWTGTARFLRPYIESSVAASAWYVRGGVLVSIVANSTRESGQGFSSASTYSRVTLQKQYAKAVSIVVTPINTTEARFPTVDNVVIGIGVQNYFDVYIHKANGQQSADDYIWTFEGV